MALGCDVSGLRRVRFGTTTLEMSGLAQIVENTMRSSYAGHRLPSVSEEAYGKGGNTRSWEV